MMYKYIGCEALLNALKEERKNGNFVFTSKWIKEIIDHLPSADVVPKSEVAQCKDCAGCTQWKCDCANIEAEAKADAAREIFDEIEKLKHTKFDWNDYVEWDAIAELKKKYTENEIWRKMKNERNISNRT